MKKEIKKFSCGCEWEVAVDDSGEIVGVNYEPEQANIDCPRLYELLASGKTKGIFQLETPLGQSTSHKCRPYGVEELSDVLSAIRPGCISCDTKIITNFGCHKQESMFGGTKKYYQRRTIEYLYRHRPELQKSIVSLNEQGGTIIKNDIKNVVYSGKKPVYSVIWNRNPVTGKWHHRNCDELTNGRMAYNLECTDDHPILTPNGYKLLSELKCGDRIAVLKIKSNKGRAGYSGRYAIGEKNFRTTCAYYYEYKCVFCDWNLGSLDVNHIEGNRKTNNHKENLCFLCPNHHRMYSEGAISKDEILKARIKYTMPHYEDIQWAYFIRKDYIGIKDTYDISMASPHNNFFAGGVVVHNCGDAIMDGKTLKQHYIDRKNGLESPDPPHPKLKDNLKETLGIGLYQEQYMKTTKELAGFTGEESYAFLKACAKKLPEKMAKFKTKFIEGCKTNSGLSQEEAENIFSILEAGQRYSFNKSHSVSYAIDSLKFSVYPKTHFPRIFFLSELEHSRGTIKESLMSVRGKIIDDAINFDVEICKPDLRLMNKEFILQDRKIYYGLTRIKGVGEGKFKKFERALGDSKPEDLSWHELLKCLTSMSSDAATNMINAGALDYTLLTRSRMVFELNIFSQLSEKQQEFMLGFDNLGEGLQALVDGGSGKNTLCYNSVSLRKVVDVHTQYNNPPASLKDTKRKISQWEISLLGYPFTCTEIDGEDSGNCTCDEFLNSEKKLDEYQIPTIISEVKQYITKGKQPGQEMAFVTLKDSTQTISAVAFPDVWLNNKQRLFEGNKVLIVGSRGNKPDSLVIKRVVQI